MCGDGAYAGLYAQLGGAQGAEHALGDLHFEGYILEGEQPTFPLPPTPVTTPGVRVIPPPTEPPIDQPE